MYQIQLDPLVNRPIIHQSQDERLMGNVNGPCLIRVPAWIKNPLGSYYLYFAHHEGDSIRLAVADSLAGPWHIHWAGALTLADSAFPTTPPHPDDLHEEARNWIAMGADGFYPHIASPDVIIDEAQQQIRLYYHGRLPDGRQRTCVAISADGLHFTPYDEVLGGPYMRMMWHNDMWYGLAMPGHVYRSADGLTNFEVGRQLFHSTERHYALWKRGNELIIFWSRVEDAPERIRASVVDISTDWTQWQANDSIEVHRPMHDWEGADLPNLPSRYGTSMQPVNQLRDPFLFEEDGEAYLLYSVAGEQGIGIGRLNLTYHR